MINNLDELKNVEILTTTKPTKYLVYEKICAYHGVPLQMDIYYSEKLRSQNERTIDKRVTKEHKLLTEISNEFKKCSFACEIDAELEIKKLLSRRLKS
jgi:transposase